MSSDNKLKAIIVDDEWLVREEMITLLRAYSNIDIVGEAENVDRAALLVDEAKPDVIFLDIQMPGKLGFELFDCVKINCDVVFITAYDQYAIKAFEVNAIDYLLKPISKERLDMTIRRIIASRRSKPGQTNQALTEDDMLYLMVDDAYKFVKISSIKCILAEGNYSYVIINHAKKELVTKTLKDWQDILPENEFIRIHRSTIVNTKFVEKIKQLQNYTNQVYVKDIETPFEMSRRFAARLKKSMLVRQD
ncbi:response regulator transcription factor [candidate division KSB1 bacterium]|nr:response regulator transcription factor [candidate division KSB1 bacterium]